MGRFMFIVFRPLGAVWYCAFEIFVCAGHSLRIQLFFLKNSTPKGLWMIVVVFFVWRFDPFRVSTNSFSF